MKREVKKTKLIIISNRLPVTIEKEDKKLSFKSSAGGLVSGLSASVETIMSLTGSKEYTWVGWPGATIEENSQESVKNSLLKNLNAYPVFLTEEEMEKFYLGFCNSTLWPLFHNIPVFATYETEDFNKYKEVNEKFANTVLEIARKDDIIWVHDYHLMILPKLLREKLANARIGFFLHIPFPSFEVIRLIPKEWRKEMLTGVLGANLIGFHTFAYEQNFLRSTRRILGLENNLGNITYEGRNIKTGVYPIGIDFEKYNNSSNEHEIKEQVEELKKSIGERRVILSIDRLDYSKGIINRLKAFELFLQKYPEYKEHITLVAVVVPSRIGVYRYQETKETIDQIIGRINGKFGSIKWTPVIYQFKNLPFEELAAIYNLGDAILVTPYADGMNLVSKEYIASQKDFNGVLILSECAGAYEEMRDTITVNPNDVEEISLAIKIALEMSKEEKININSRIQSYLKKYDIKWWTEKFIGELLEQGIPKREVIFVSEGIIGIIQKKYENSHKRLLIFDYDGTLSPLVSDPKLAKPSKKLEQVLVKLSKDPSNTVLVASGRDKSTLEEWLGHLKVNLSAEHGVYLKESGKKWSKLFDVNASWKEDILDILKLYSDRLPHSFIEEKDYSLVLHFRNSEEELANSIIPELFDIISDITANTDLLVQNISKGLEVKNMYVNKGLPVLKFLTGDHDFILAAGDDSIDEEIFEVLPENAFSIKVGGSETNAKYFVKNVDDMIGLLEKLPAKEKTFLQKLLGR